MVQNNSTNFILSILYAYVFVYLLPWTIWSGADGEIVDVVAYLDRIIYLHEGGREAEHWGLSWLLSEPLWKGIIILIGEWFTDYRAVLYFISFLIVFSYSYFIMKRVEFYVAIMFLTMPMFVDLSIAQIRSAVAFSIVLFAYDLASRENKSKVLPIILLILATLIHISMPVFYAIYYLLYWLDKRVEERKYYLFAIGTALFLALFMKYGSNLILTMLGDRHAGYDEYISGSSVAYSITWFIIAIIIAIFGDFADKRKRVVAAYAITIMSFFFFSSILGIFAARYVAITMPFVIIAISYLPKHIKQGTYLFLFLYNLYSFKYWFQFTIL